MLIYSAGLRVGEVVKLKPEDIDSRRMLIHIKGAKGRKDRYTILSETALDVLRKYWREYKPQKWLFEGARKDRYISARTVQHIMEHACTVTGIHKDNRCIHCATALLHIYLRVAWIYDTYKNCLVMPIARQRRFISMSAQRAWERYRVLWTI